MQLRGELALGTCDWRELAVGTAGVFIPEMEGGAGRGGVCAGGGWGKPLTDQNCEQMFP